ncbi:guanylate kinase [Schinkia azotoformans MEV2011]|uniref:Guanylate kinase n=1 Tax=Schinkia azotoformans MEV2011 TaxID=1348973 RepID=A0A072NE79_SCHAZ|nr:guanylate kinase [Schinkia azotoformans]KEF35974.1 guanylate kinase [Schinkia azotoformans MEV2011]MEC1694537.1 guanylate kinase [Schinkia azotoformans]MEC1716529.1 guanylate kinase [Schinkia azotoformans]MEC1725241.1 guanylate kinase [Schinkia azotoformans]MEC1739367.1 guanylate kinase [Schinkia azotoformans]
MYQVKEKERIFIYTGPDGSGRKTIAKMVSTVFDMETVISYTTRQPRHYETDGKDYHFVSEDAFAKMEEQQEFLESVEIDGIKYGIREEDIVKAFENHNFIYLTLNPEGTEKLKKMYGEKVIRLFVYADRDTVVSRQKERQDSEEDIQRHLSHYDETMNYKNECEHTFENFDSPQVSFQVSEVIEKYLDRNLVQTDY